MTQPAKPRIPVSQPYQWGNEIPYVTKALRDNWISSAGEFLGRFETEFAKYCNVRHGVACVNGTVACHLAFAAAGIGPGDEVICPDFTMMAPVFSIMYLGAKPVFVDADARSWTIDVTKIEAAITYKTKAILAVHIYGHPCDMESILRIAKKYNLTVLEDAAEAHGADVQIGGEWRRAGGIGLAAAFSFYANKNITTGEGGMVVTDDDGIAERVRSLKNLRLGNTNETRFIHDGVGYQYRMTNLHAAIGCAQMEHADDARAAKIAIAEQYHSLLANIPGVALPPSCEWGRNVYWVYGILIEDEFGVGRAETQRRLAAEGIETRTFFYPSHRQPHLIQQKALAPSPDDAFPVSNRLWERGLYIPSYIGMGDAAIERVAAAIRAIR
ncbi:MAG: DegT/DnrJ/EryC1/StrS family aminotransferase [Planctomycetes bacterium]|nr:DegT/DnrJ/EryC1/StrS family aminotransferase [Planctomycetota bacterium]